MAELGGLADGGGDQEEARIVGELEGQRLAPIPVFLDPDGPAPAGHVARERRHAFDGLRELMVQLRTAFEVHMPIKPGLCRLVVREGFARPGIWVEIVHLPGGDAEFVAAASDEIATGLDFRSGLDGARAVLVVERCHALHFLRIADVMVPHGGRSFHRAPCGAAGTFALDAIRARSVPPSRQSIFPEREAPSAPSSPWNAY